MGFAGLNAGLEVDVLEKILKALSVGVNVDEHSVDKAKLRVAHQRAKEWAGRGGKDGADVVSGDDAF